MAVDIFDTRIMTQMIEEGHNTKHVWLRDRYFTNRPTFTAKKIDFDVVGRGGRRIAPFVSPLNGGKVIDRDGYSTLSYEAPMVAPQRTTTAEDVLKRLAGENPYSGKSPTMRAAEILGRDLAELDEYISRREEAMCSEALFSGKVTVKGDGVNEVLNFWSTVPASEKPETTLTTKWDASTATAETIMSDLRVVRRSMIKDGGFTPRDLICGTNVIDTILSKLTASKSLDMRRVDMGHIDPQHLPDGVTYWGYLKDSALDIYSYDEWYKGTDGDVAMVPADKCLLATPGAKTMLAYGACPVISETNPGIVFVEGSRVPMSWIQRSNPMGRVLQISSRPLPIIQQIHAFHVINATGS